MTTRTLDRILSPHPMYKAALYTDGVITMTIGAAGKTFPANWKNRDAMLSFFAQPIPEDEDGDEFAGWEDTFCKFL